jgi:uncharacterized delta-60 repeat protein
VGEASGDVNAVGLEQLRAYMDSSSIYRISFMLDTNYDYQTTVTLKAETGSSTIERDLIEAGYRLIGPSGEIFLGVQQGRDFGYGGLSGADSGSLAAGNYVLEAWAKQSGDYYRGENYSGGIASYEIALGLTPAGPRPEPTDGDIDPSFGSGGKVVGDFGCEALALQSDGKIVAAGSFRTAIDPFDLDFVLERYNSDGSRDATFGVSGKALTDLGGLDYLEAIALQPDGKIVAAGDSQTIDPFDPDFALARYNTDGSLDVGFGSGGKVLTDLDGDDYLNAVALQLNGKIVAAGYRSLRGTNSDLALVRYNADGSLDATFGAGGKVLTDFGGYDHGNAIALQPDGKIVVAGGSTYVSPDNPDFVLVRYNADGSLDPSFGSGGKVLIDFGASAMVLQPDGKIVAAGTADGPDFVLARYNADGSLDASFGSGGKVVTDFGGTEHGHAIALQPDGKIVAVGTTDSALNVDFALARYDPDGSLDASFGSGGRVRTGFRLGEREDATGVVIQSDGKIVAGGTIYNEGIVSRGVELALVRYLSSPHSQPTITTHPVSHTNVVGSSVMLSVTATNTGAFGHEFPSRGDRPACRVTECVGRTDG